MVGCHPYYRQPDEDGNHDNPGRPARRSGDRLRRIHASRLPGGEVRLPETEPALGALRGVLCMESPTSEHAPICQTAAVPGDNFVARLIAQAQAHISEPVLGVVVVERPRRAGSAGVASTTGFRTRNVLGLTDVALYAFRAGGTLKPHVESAIGTWPWGTFTASAGAGHLMESLQLGWNDGSSIDLEVRVRGVNRFQHEQVAEIVRRAKATRT